MMQTDPLSRSSLGAYSQVTSGLTCHRIFHNVYTTFDRCIEHKGGTITDSDQNGAWILFSPLMGSSNFTVKMNILHPSADRENSDSTSVAVRALFCSPINNGFNTTPILLLQQPLNQIFITFPKVSTFKHFLEVLLNTNGMQLKCHTPESSNVITQ